MTAGTPIKATSLGSADDGKLKFECPGCGKHLAVPEDYAGRMASCTKCGAPLLFLTETPGETNTVDWRVRAVVPALILTGVSLVVSVAATAWAMSVNARMTRLEMSTGATFGVPVSSSPDLSELQESARPATGKALRVHALEVVDASGKPVIKIFGSDDDAPGVYFANANGEFDESRSVRVTDARDGLNLHMGNGCAVIEKGPNATRLASTGLTVRTHEEDGQEFTSTITPFSIGTAMTIEQGQTQVESRMTAGAYRIVRGNKLTEQQMQGTAREDWIKLREEKELWGVDYDWRVPATTMTFYGRYNEPMIDVSVSPAVDDPNTNLSVIRLLDQHSRPRLVSGFSKYGKPAFFFYDGDGNQVRVVAGE